jgi:two-component system, NarL family, nitrate/nitrite response regulator NarL
MDAILLISRQLTLVEKWQPVLALNYTVTVVPSVPLAMDFTAYALVIVDSQMIDDQSFAISQIKQSSAKCLIVGEHWPEELQVNSLIAGAAGYCEAAASASLILKALESVLQNDIWIQRHLIHKVIGALMTPNGESKTEPNPTAKLPTLAEVKFACLSKREQDVAHLICQGISNKRIAATLFISERTVKAHLTSIFTKLKVSNRLHLGLLLKEAEE